MAAMPLVRPSAQNLGPPRTKGAALLVGAWQTARLSPACEANSGGKAVTLQSMAFCAKRLPQLICEKSEAYGAEHCAIAAPKFTTDKRVVELRSRSWVAIVRGRLILVHMDPHVFAALLDHRARALGIGDVDIGEVILVIPDKEDRTESRLFLLAIV